MLIGEIAHRTGVSARMLRHYESLGLLEPSGRTSGGYREYGEADLRRIFHIESLRTLGMSLQEVKGALEDPGFNPQHLVAELISDTRQRLLRERELLSRLRAVQAAGAPDWETVLGVIELLQGLRSPEPAQRQNAALSVGGQAAPPAVALAESALREGNLNVAGALSWAVLQAGEPALVAVARGLDSRDVEIRRRAVRILAESGQRLPGLFQALQDTDPEVRSLAALALAQQADPRAIPELLAMLLEGNSDVTAAEALATIVRGDLATRTPLIGQFHRELRERPPGDPARARLTQALAEFPGAEVAEILRELQTDTNRQVALTATAILKIQGEQIR
ncbi:HEAT repeat domain-containing protein [Corynebacterium sp. A21]|uniref:HEAT repeat domain-containing protein n=1 Tax=Corynebacterium sp. A21 TaxID=3457318 RepID=UPI003FD252C1